MSQPLQFVPFSSFIEPGFWSKLTDLKLTLYKLDDSLQPLNGFYANTDAPGVPCRFSIDYNSISKSITTSENNTRLGVKGNMIVCNTIETFKATDKTQLLNTSGKTVIDAVKNIESCNSIEDINSVFLFAFIDLKKYIYYYWFAFPALRYPDNLQVSQMTSYDDFSKTCSILTFESSYNAWIANHSTVGFVKVATSLDVECLSADNLTTEDGFFVFRDPSTQAGIPGWPLRNFIAFVACHRFKNGIKHNEIKIMCLRKQFRRPSPDFSHSFMLTITYDIPNIKIVECGILGWERNSDNKLLPRCVNLSSTMDKNKLADNATQLNLQLMRWRIVPELNLDVIAQQKCLLFGAGTLGSNVARCLLGWGVKNVTFVDCANVSYSNPVRQSLFTFNDSISANNKALVAANSLRLINPNVNALGINLRVPMPGHVVSPSEEASVEKDVLCMDDLIKTNDVVFLLMDSRESRWLPSVLGTLHEKVVLSVALGFDSYVVIRHGIGQLNVDGMTDTQKIMRSGFVDGCDLACYFCSDVVAPGDSTSDRTLDQQCTVTRPGVSYIASALAVELFVSVLQHSSGPKAAAETVEGAASNGHLGSVPHQIRGFLSRYDQFTPAVPRFVSCVACSRTVTDEYVKSGFKFLLKVFNGSDILEELTGLKELQMVSDHEVLFIWIEFY